MEALINALINAGGMGVLSAALLWLHASAIYAFREELKTERRLFREALRAIGVAIPIDEEERESGIGNGESGRDKKPWIS